MAGAHLGKADLCTRSRCQYFERVEHQRSARCSRVFDEFTAFHSKLF
jgi:hypothetical protein